MNPERWKLIGETYHDAIELTPEDRLAFLEKLSAKDPDLRREVESLIQASENAREFIASPALNDAAKLMAATPEGPQWKDGMEIGHYRLKSLLGMGGMSEVYLALDIRLNRNVAVKLLHPECARDAIAKERLFREARAVAALSHENIVAIHSIEEADETVFIVMEYVEGRALTDVFAEQAQSLQTLLDIGAQIAHALQAAHDAGLIHRDIKPGNVLLTGTGQVKLLDFGIARIVVQETLGEVRSSELPIPLTAEGRVLGTAAYMSPEQIRRESLDGRSDIFSLGALLYEAITGRPPFKGSSELSLTHAIIADGLLRPTVLRPELPSRVDLILETALSKNRDSRYQSASDFARDLIDLRNMLAQDDISNLPTRPHLPNLASIGKEVPRPSLRKALSAPLRPEARSTIAIVGVMLVLLAAFGFYKWNRRTKVPAPNETIITNTGNVANGVAAISPDGKYVVYAVMDGPQTSSLWLRPTGAASLVKLVPSSDVAYSGVTFSRDGNHIYFVQRARESRISSLYRMPLLGGGASRVLDDIAGPVSFSPDGKRFVFRRGAPNQQSELIVARSDGSDQKSVTSTSSPEFFGEPSWSPDGRLIACSSGHSDGGANRYVIGVSVDDWKVSTISRRKWRWIGSVAWLPDGQGLLMIATDSPADPYRVWRLSYPAGDEARVTSNSSIYSRLSLASDLDSMLVSVVKRSTNMWVEVPGQPQLSKKLTFGLGGFRSHLSWTNAGIVIDSEMSGTADISIMDDEGGNQRQLLGDLTAKGTPVSPSVTPDGRYIVFAFDRTGARHIWRMDLDGSNLRQLTNGAGEDQPSCSPDGKWVVYTTIGAEITTLSKVSIDGGETQQLTTGHSRNPSFSPDGNLISYLSSETVRDFRWRITVIPSAGGPAVTTFGQEVYNTYPAKWTRDGAGLGYIDFEQSGILVQPLSGGAPRRVTAPGRDLIFGFDWSPDGQRLAVVRGIWERDLVLIKDFQ